MRRWLDFREAQSIGKYAGWRTGIASVGGLPDYQSDKSSTVALLDLTPALPQHEEVQTLYLVSRPGRFAQDSEAGSDTGLVAETTHWHALGQTGPAVVRRQRGHDGFQGQAMQGVSGLARCGCGQRCCVVGVCHGTILAEYLRARRGGSALKLRVQLADAPHRHASGSGAGFDAELDVDPLQVLFNRDCPLAPELLS